MHFSNNRRFPKWKGNSVKSANSRNLVNFWTMDWDQFKDLIYYLRLIGYVVIPWYLMKGITGSNNPFSNKYFCH